MVVTGPQREEDINTNEVVCRKVAPHITSVHVSNVLLEQRRHGEEYRRNDWTVGKGSDRLV